MKEEGRRKREEGRGKNAFRLRDRVKKGKREEGRGKKEEGRGKNAFRLRDRVKKGKKEEGVNY
ncbi:hypothetical protein [Microcoleus sp. MON2_D5]|uniref:hypothetical protein n=1 Tax=Microcoleus sp. MON2_D5 TaxID=2818833 RepID=UPI002FD06E14